MNEEKNYIEIIEKKANLNLKRDEDKLLFPIGVRHQKELKNLLNDKICKLNNKISMSKDKLYKIFEDFYEDDIKNLKKKFSNSDLKIQGNLNIIWKEISKDLRTFLSKKSSLEKTFKNVHYSISGCDNSNWNDLSIFLNKDKCINDIDRTYLNVKLDNNYNEIIDDVFRDNYSSLFDKIRNNIERLKSLFNECVVLGDLSQVREIYYSIDGLDKELVILDSLEIKKIDNIFKDFELNLKTFSEIDSKEFIKENIISNNNKIIDV